MSIYIEMGKRGHNSLLGEIFHEVGLLMSFQKNSRFKLHDYIPASTNVRLSLPVIFMTVQVCTTTRFINS